MRILRINDYMGTPGGTESYIEAVSARLTALGHPQRLLTISDVEEHLAYRRMPGEEVFPLRALGVRRVLEDLVDLPPLRERLAQIVSEFRPDLIHLHHFDSLFTPLARFLRDVAVPIVITAHDAKLVCPIATLVLPDGRLCEGGILPRCQFTGCAVGFGLPYKLEQVRIFRDMVMPRISLYLAPSQAARAFLERHGMRPTRVLAPIVEIPAAVLEQPPRPISSGPVVGFLGRIEAYKGVMTLVEAWPKVRAALPGARLVFAGRGPLEAALRQRAADLHLEGAVQFRGWVDGPAKEAFFEEIQLLAVPSEGYENFGLIGLEAMARGRGVLGSRLGGIPDWLIDGEVGRLLAPGDREVWAQALVEALRSPEQVARWGAQARRRYLDHYPPQVHVVGLLDAYQSVLSAPGPNR